MKRALIYLLLCCLPSTVSGQTRTDAIEYATADYVAGAMIRPARFLEHALVANLLEQAGDPNIIDAVMKQFQQGTGFDPRDIEDVTILLDRKTILGMARISEDSDDEIGSSLETTNHMKHVALAMHNFYDTYKEFPDHDGRDDDNKGNLSWRVHLLPFLDQAALYNEFHLDEPWDSDHNKTLIERMPEIFQSPGVEANGKTALHGIVGENTIFSGNGAVRFQQITDGTSNTIMFVTAGKDKADIWTKPGGIKLQDGPPENTLGDIGSSFLFARCDGSVDSYPTSMTEVVFHRLVVYNDGKIVRNAETATRQERLPSWIVRTRSPINRDQLLAALKPMGEAAKGEVAEATAYTIGEYGLAFPNDTTLIATPIDLLPKVLKSKNASGKFATTFRAFAADKDVAFGVNFETLQPLKDRMAGNFPMAGVAENIESVMGAMDLTGGGNLIQEMEAKTSTDLAAAQLAALAQGLVQIQKVQLMQLSNRPDSPIPADAMQTIAELYSHVEVKADGKSVSYSLPKPDDLLAFMLNLKPLVTELMSVSEKEIAAQKKHNLKMLAIAFHNYHDAYNAFPRFNGDANPNSDKARRGLSWRVHLLPFIEHEELYEKFALNEPWDSETNKALIDQMPSIYRTDGVDKPGHTAIHVFIGEKAPFGDGTSLTRIRNFLDGTSNTILAVEAGTDTADIWTKPGGLKFTGQNTIELFGNIGKTFRAMLCDGSVKTFSGDIEEDLLNNLIQHNDGNPVTF